MLRFSNIYIYRLDIIMLAEEKGILWYMIGRTEKVLYYIMNDL